MGRRVMSLIGVVMFAVLTAQAQPPITRGAVKVLTNEDRTRSTVTSITYTVPPDAAVGAQVTARLDIPLSNDWSDERNSVRMTLLDWDEARGVWHNHAGQTWVGNPVDGYDTELATQVSGLCSRDVRLEIEVLRGIRVGATMGLREPAQ
jgi:hypothetical protein